MDFSQAEEKFRELQARVQRGEPLSEEQYQEELAKLMVQDDHGTFWSLEPGTGRWLYFNGTEWVPGTPPRPQPPAAPVPPAPVSAPMETAPTTTTPTVSTATTPTVALPTEQTPEPETEPVPTYVRAGEAGEAGGRGAPGGIPPRPVRESPLLGPGGDRPWLPFAMIAIVLALCAAALLFGVRNLPFFASAQVTPTATEVAVIAPTVEPTLPVATDTPMPTAAPAASPTAQGVTATTTDKVRVRAGPGTTYGILTSLASGTTVPATGRNADSSWIQVQLPGGTDTGWMSAQFLTINGDVNSLPVVQPGPTPSPTKKAPGAKPTATETPAG